MLCDETLFSKSITKWIIGTRLGKVLRSKVTIIVKTGLQEWVMTGKMENSCWWVNNIDDMRDFFEFCESGVRNMMGLRSCWRFWKKIENPRIWKAIIFNDILADSYTDFWSLFEWISILGDFLNRLEFDFSIVNFYRFFLKKQIAQSTKIDSTNLRFWEDFGWIWCDKMCSRCDFINFRIFSVFIQKYWGERGRGGDGCYCLVVMRWLRLCQNQERRIRHRIFSSRWLE